MRFAQTAALTVLLLALARTSSAYLPTTHEDLSENALNRSVLNGTGLLTSLGLQEVLKDETLQGFPNSKGARQSIKDLFRGGANFEDDFPRSLNHFFNPLNGSGLTFGIVTGLPSPDWALEDHGDVNGQEFSYKHARQYFFDALTKPVKAERDRNFGLTFQTLGQVIHHLQDMAQPQHVRNDPHCDAIFPCGLVGLHNPSLYEKYTDDVRNNLPFGGYAPVYDDSNTSIFTIPRKLWRTSPEGQSDISRGMGIAEYTNRNFVSAGTNFDKPGLFPSPVFDPATKQEVDIKTLIPGTGLSGIVTFYGNIVQDTLRPGETRANPRASTESIFDQDLRAIGKDPVFSLNRFNFDQAHKFLIPRAVAYSAGLINYFFRGQIDILPDPVNPGKYIIKNLGPEAMTGDFTLYYDAVDGMRYPANNQWNAVAIAPGAQSAPLS